MQGERILQCLLIDGGNNNCKLPNFHLMIDSLVRLNLSHRHSKWGLFVDGTSLYEKSGKIRGKEKWSFRALWWQYSRRICRNYADEDCPKMAL